MPDHFTDENEGKPVKPFTKNERRKFSGGNCFICGYNGANYFQTSVHACARRYHADDTSYAATLEAAVERLQRELHTMQTAGIIEVAVRNSNVAEYMNHWEAVATSAEASLVKAREALKQIAEQDDVELALDPSWAKRIATATLGDQT